MALASVLALHQSTGMSMGHLRRGWHQLGVAQWEASGQEGSAEESERAASVQVATQDQSLG